MINIIARLNEIWGLGIDADRLSSNSVVLSTVNIHFRAMGSLNVPFHHILIERANIHLDERLFYLIDWLMNNVWIVKTIIIKSRAFSG